MDALGWVGTGLQVAGLVVTAAGMFRTWRDFGPSEPFLAPVSRSLRRVQGRAAAMLRRVLRRSSPAIVRVGGSDMGLGTFRPRARAGFGRVPKHDLTAAVGILEDRTRRTWDAVSDLNERVADDREASEARDRELGARIEAEAARLAATDRQIAAGGIRLEAVGLVVVAVGIVVQGLGS